MDTSKGSLWHGLVRRRIRFTLENGFAIAYLQGKIRRGMDRTWFTIEFVPGDEVMVTHKRQQVYLVFSQRCLD